MLDTLFNIIEDRKKENPPGSYTCFLFDEGEETILRKINEEAFEVILASKGQGDQRLIEEAADLIYHLLVLLSYKNLTLEMVKNELSLRHIRKS
jgi:phosphoribosyl-ATP pyrophosphohydrolase